MEHPLGESNTKDGEAAAPETALQASATLMALGVPLPSDDGTYSLGEALLHILQFPKRSNGRAAVINAMID
ncbi:hypothetical protein ACHAXT_004794 [Thalassiosira profunda]